MFESRISAGATEKLLGWEKSHAQTVAWSYDMEGHAQKCVDRYCELAHKKVEQIYRVSSLCLDDNQFKQEELESVGKLPEVCSQIVLKYLYSARSGRPDILWSASLRDQSQNGLRHVTDAWQGWFLTFITRSISDNIVMWEILRTQNQPQEVSCVFLEVTRSSQWVGCPRNELLFRTVPQSLRSLLWMQDYVWMGYLLLIFGT